MQAKAEAPKNIAVDRALVVLGAFVGVKSPLSLTEISQKLGLDKSVVHRILITLVQHRFLEQDTQTKKFQVGVRLWELGQNFAIGARMDEIAVPLLAAIVNQHEGTTGYIGVLDDTQVTFVNIVNAAGPMKLHVSFAKRTPAFSNSVGRAILAYLPPEKLAAVLDHPHFMRDAKAAGWSPDFVRSELAAARTRGYAVNREEAAMLGAVAAPVLDRNGFPVASIGITYPLFAPFEALPNILPGKVRHMASVTSEQL